MEGKCLLDICKMQHFSLEMAKECNKEDFQLQKSTST